MSAPGEFHDQARKVVVRPVTVDDIPELTELLVANREFLRPWDPARPEGFFTTDGQARALQDLLERQRQGATRPYVIVGPDGAIVGRITLDGIVRGAFQSALLGYWVGQAHNRRGFATTAVAAVVDIAFDELGLHRIEAGTLPHNTASQRVLARNGFVRYGLAPGLLRIAGRWEDHVMYQRLNEHWSAPDPGPPGHPPPA